MPTPAAAMLVMSGLIIFGQAVNAVSDWIRIWGIVCFGLVIIAAVLMNAYPIRYLHLGRFMSRHPWFGRASFRRPGNPDKTRKGTLIGKPFPRFIWYPTSVL
jgi:hypothetical protein